LNTFKRIEELARNKGKIDGVPTGYTDLDNLLTGMHKGEFILVAGRPSMGKTALGMNIVENAAIRHGVKAAVFSLEMPAEQLVMRMLCSQARVNMQSVRQGTLRDDDWLKLVDAMAPIAKSQINIDDTGGITVPAIRSKARRLQMERGLDLIMIDYLQLMSATGRFGSRQEEVSSISRSLKGLAQELGVPVLVMSQLSRAPAGRSNHVPILSDIRDSGAIEQDADVVMFIHRENYYDPATEKGNIADIIVAKQRNGPLATIELAYIGEYTRFISFLRT
jgi:replicative DNA helicase